MVACALHGKRSSPSGDETLRSAVETGNAFALKSKFPFLKGVDCSGTTCSHGSALQALI